MLAVHIPLIILVCFVIGLHCTTEGKTKGSSARCVGGECMTTACVTEECKRSLSFKMREETKVERSSSSHAFAGSVTAEHDYQKCYCRPPPTPPPPPNMKIEKDIIIILEKIIKIEQRIELLVQIKESHENMRNDIIAFIKVQMDNLKSVLEAMRTESNAANVEIAKYHHDIQIAIRNYNNLQTKVAEIHQLIIKNSQSPAVPTKIDESSINTIVQVLVPRIQAMFVGQAESTTKLQLIVAKMETKIQLISTSLAAVMEKIQWIVKNLRQEKGGGCTASCIQKEIQQVLIIEQELQFTMKNIIHQVKINGQLVNTLINEGGGQQLVQEIMVVCQGLKAELMKLTRIVVQSFNQYSSEVTKTSTLIETFSKEVKSAQILGGSKNLVCAPGTTPLATPSNNDGDLLRVKDKVDPDQESNEDDTSS